MSQRIVLVAHGDDGGDDRASRHLRATGYEVAWTCPAQGGVLPEPDERHAGAIVYGGLQSVNSAARNAYLRQELDWIGRWIGQGKPLLGICLGGQLLAHSLGARVGPHPAGLHEYGYVEVRPTAAGQGVFPGPIHLYQAHYEGFELPPGATLLAGSEHYPHQAFRYGIGAYGFQFHPEVTPAIMQRWLDADAGSERMRRPGVHSRERQLADEASYGAAMGAWFAGFLDRWLAEGQALERL